MVRAVDWTDVEAFIGVLILARAYRSNNKTLSSLWEDETGRAIFLAVMPLKIFQKLSSDLMTRPQDLLGMKLTS